MAEAGLEFSAEPCCWNWEPSQGYKLTRRLLKSQRPRALLCLNDRMAFGAYQALAEADMDVPDAVAVVSFDNDELASYMRPGLTTIGLPHEAMGRRAVEMLLARQGEGDSVMPMPPVIRSSLRTAS